jgi:hypothetical protein
VLLHILIARGRNECTRSSIVPLQSALHRHPLHSLERDVFSISVPPDVSINRDLRRRPDAVKPPPYFPTTGRYFKNRYYEIDPLYRRGWFAANQ